MVAWCEVQLGFFCMPCGSFYSVDFYRCDEILGQLATRPKEKLHRHANVEAIELLNRDEIRRLRRWNPQDV